MRQCSSPAHPLREQLLTAALGDNDDVLQTRAAGDLERLRLILAAQRQRDQACNEPRTVAKFGREGV
jgi:hypothetical protein